MFKVKLLFHSIDVNKVIDILTTYHIEIVKIKSDYCWIIVHESAYESLLNVLNKKIYLGVIPAKKLLIKENLYKFDFCPICKNGKIAITGAQIDCKPHDKVFSVGLTQVHFCPHCGRKNIKGDD